MDVYVWLFPQHLCGRWTGRGWWGARRLEKSWLTGSWGLTWTTGYRGKGEGVEHYSGHKNPHHPTGEVPGPRDQVESDPCLKSGTEEQGAWPQKGPLGDITGYRNQRHATEYGYGGSAGVLSMEILACCGISL